MCAVVVNPTPDIPAREGDEQLTPQQLNLISLIDKLKQKPTFARFPGAVVLRRFRKGETIVRMGEPGWTAFYVLETEDLLSLRQTQLTLAEERLQRPAPEGQRPGWRDELTQRAEVLRQELRGLEARAAELAAAGKGEAAQELRRAVTAFLPIDSSEAPRPAGMLSRLIAGFRRPKVPKEDPAPLAIASDGPTDLDGQTRRAAMYEGDLFGEMACMTRLPRAATVRADRDVYLLEMLGNVLDMIRKDDGFREYSDEMFRRRALNLQLRTLPIIGQLPPDLFRRIQERAELATYEPGDVVWDEHDAADSLCLVRSGLVQVVRGLHYVVGPDDVPTVQRTALCQELARGEQAGDPAAWAWRLLTEPAQVALRSLTLRVELPDSESQATLTGQATKPESNEGRPLWETVRGAINELIQSRRVIESFGKKKKADLLMAAGQSGAALADLPEELKEWTDLDARLFNRLWLEGCLPSLPLRRLLAVRRRTLAYVGRGEFFGEGCVLPDRIRRGTCVAYNHPDTGQSIGGGKGITPSRLELVRIRREDLLEILTPELLEQIRDVARQRLGNNAAATETPAAEVLLDPMHPHFEELGLLQGQKLMLIDLDRCTRCGDCMRACINTHSDGASRLYLDGPRFGNYLVPNTCRQCLDPVCMVGCPVRSIVRGNDGQIEIKSWCIGCQACADQCPYGSIQMHALTGLHLTTPPPPAAPAYAFEPEASGEVEEREVKLRAVVCDQCASSPLGEPACVYHCPHDAAFRMEGRSLMNRT